MRLEPLTKEQCEIVRVWRNNTLETLRTPYPLTEEMQADFFKNVINNRNSPHRYWSIIEGVGEFADVEHRLIGMGGLTGIQWENRIAEISLIIDPALRNKGYGKQAVALLLDEGFKRMNLQTIFGECYQVNESGCKFWENIVTTYNGYMCVLPKRKFWNGQFWDSMYFSIDTEEFRKVKPLNS